MPNQLTTTGLQTATQSELYANMSAALQAIYGANIDLSSNSPDGQMLNIFIQAALDLEDLLTQIYNQFDPDNAVGAVLDQRVAINGIQRQAGTYTIQPVSITTSQALNLYGLDQSAQPVFTVADNAGNQWQLLTTVSLPTPGVYSLSFQAANPGAIQSALNSITVPVTIILGVTAINNPTIYTTLGINEESDALLKVRRQKSVSLASSGYLAGLLAALENISGVTYAYIEENTTAATNSDGVPGHSIWVIVAGSGASASIAQAIYTKRNAGCGMYGGVSYTITQADGSLFNVYWDVVVQQPLFIEFTATSINGSSAPQIAAILAALPTSFTPGVYSEVNINELATLVQQIDPNTLVTNAGFSLAYNGAYTNTLLPSTKKQQFAVSQANIIITPMILTPTSSTVAPAGQVTFLGLGGYSTLTYSILVNNSGGSIVGATGVYTAGPSAGVDTIKVTDFLGNTATAGVTVT